MFRLGRKALSTFVAIAVAVGSISSLYYGKVSASAETSSGNLSTTNTATSSSNPYGLAKTIQDGAILQAFGWSFKTITDNMQSIAEAGYTAVQTMPVSAINNGSGGSMAWWNSDKSSGGPWGGVYQPTDYTGGHHVVGSEDDLKTMCATAKQYGVKVIVDVVANHTTGDISKVSQNMKNAAGGSSEGTLYHYGGTAKIADYTSRYTGIQHEMMGGLFDLNTENTGRQKDLIS